MSDALARARFDVAMPDRIKRLPRDKRGYPVPWFVHWKDGEPIFPAMDPEKWMQAVKRGRCWVCGDVMGRHLCFVVGPMCTINRISAEPPSHLECGQYAARVCPFMVNPRMGRVPPAVAGLDHWEKPGGLMEQRNPGIMALWQTRTFSIMPTNTGPLVQMGSPERVEWWKEGRLATPHEALEGFEAGAEFLEQRALQLDGEAALPQLRKLVARARQTVLPLLPP